MKNDNQKYSQTSLTTVQFRARGTPLSTIVAETILLVQLVRARFYHVNEIGEGFFLFNRYRLKVFHNCLQ